MRFRNSYLSFIAVTVMVTGSMAQDQKSGTITVRKNEIAADVPQPIPPAQITQEAAPRTNSNQYRLEDPVGTRLEGQLTSYVGYGKLWKVYRAFELKVTRDSIAQQQWLERNMSDTVHWQYLLAPDTPENSAEQSMAIPKRWKTLVKEYDESGRRLLAQGDYKVRFDEETGFHVAYRTGWWKIIDPESRRIRNLFFRKGFRRHNGSFW